MTDDLHKGFWFGCAYWDEHVYTIKKLQMVHFSVSVRLCMIGVIEASIKRLQ